MNAVLSHPDITDPVENHEQPTTETVMVVELRPDQVARRPDNVGDPGRGIDEQGSDTDSADVRYGGSLTEHHGPARQLWQCHCPDCETATRSRWNSSEGDDLGEPRWRLQLPDGSVLSHVHYRSFTREPPRLLPPAATPPAPQAGRPAAP